MEKITIARLVGMISFIILLWLIFVFPVKYPELEEKLTERQGISLAKFLEEIPDGKIESGIPNKERLKQGTVLWAKEYNLNRMIALIFSIGIMILGLIISMFLHVTGRFGDSNSAPKEMEA